MLFYLIIISSNMLQLSLRATSKCESIERLFFCSFAYIQQRDSLPDWIFNKCRGEKNIERNAGKRTIAPSMETMAYLTRPLSFARCVSLAGHTSFADHSIRRSRKHDVTRPWQEQAGNRISVSQRVHGCLHKTTYLSREMRRDMERFLTPLGCVQERNRSAYEYMQKRKRKRGRERREGERTRAGRKDLAV